MTWGGMECWLPLVRGFQDSILKLISDFLEGILPSECKMGDMDVIRWKGAI